MSPRFDAVVFDWYATLGAPDVNDWWLEMWARIDAAGAVVPDEARAAWVTPPTDHTHASVDEATYRRYEEDRLSELLAASGLYEAAVGPLMRELMVLRDAEEVGVYPDVERLLTDLRDAGTVVALCSNWSWDLDRHLDANGIAPHFDTVVCSAVVGYRKPHRAIFEHLLDELDLPAQRVAFVGDDWEADIQGASALGMASFHLARERCAVVAHGDVPCPSGLDELRPHLL